MHAFFAILPTPTKSCKITGAFIDMSPNSSFEQYKRALRERFQIFRQSLDELVAALSGNVHLAKVEASKTVLKTLEDVKNMVSEQDRPSWVPPLQQSLSLIVGNPTNENVVVSLLKTVLATYLPAMSHIWALKSTSGSEPVRFDEIYIGHYEQCRIPELFENLIVKLQELVESNEVERVSAIRALEKLIATLKMNIKGSYFATYRTWEFARSVCKNTLIEGVLGVPVLGVFAKGVKAALEETNKGMVEVEKRVNAEVTSRTGFEVQMLASEPAIFRALPPPQTPV